MLKYALDFQHIGLWSVSEYDRDGEGGAEAFLLTEETDLFVSFLEN